MRIVAIACALVLALAGCEQVQKSAAPSMDIQAPAAAAYHQRVLANGLTVLSIPDQETANVSVQVWYRVGSKDDPQGRSGFAHLFEHMMFKATRNLPGESYNQMTEDVGGSNNANTWNDFTNYYSVVPANHLERILFAEADRMASLVIDQETFDAERNVVKEEYRERILANAYGPLFGLYVQPESFAGHPYGRPSIGSMEDLDAATLDDVRRFHATFYRPDNAVLIVAGRFDEAQFNAMVDRYFGPIEKPLRPIPANDGAVPPRTAGRLATYYAPNVPFPATVMSYAIPGFDHPDRPALTILNAVLSSGGSSRLYNDIVYVQQIANGASSDMQVYRRGGIFTLTAVMTGGHGVAQGEAALSAQVARLHDELVNPSEMIEARNELVAAILRGRETADERAFSLGYAAMMTDDPGYGDGEIARLSAVTAQDVQRVARKYLVDDARVTIRYLDESSRAAQTMPPAPVSAAVIRLEDLAPLGKVVTLAPPAARVPLPPVGPPVSIPTPTVTALTLENGMRVVVAPSDKVPLASAWMVFDAGSSLDPAGKSGLAMMVADLLTSGTAEQSAPDFASQMERLGAVVGAEAQKDLSYVYANAPLAAFDRTMDLLTQMVRTPGFDVDDFEHSRAQSLDGVQWSRTDPGTVAGTVMNRLLYEAGRYGSPTDGTVKSLTGITRDDVIGFYRTYWQPSRATLVFSGSIEPERAFALARRYFGDWRDSQPVPAAPALTMPAARRVVVVDQPLAGQAAVMAGAAAVKYADPDYYPLMVASAILGGGGNARLNKAIRVDRGLSYGAWATLFSGSAGGALRAYAQTRNDAADEVADIMLAEFRRLGEVPVPRAELDARIEPVIGEFGRTLETADGLGSIVAGMVFYGKPLTELSEYAPRIRAVTPEQIQAAARRYLAPDKVNLVFYGDAKAFVGPLRREFRDLTVIPLGEVNIDEPIPR